MTDASPVLDPAPVSTTRLRPASLRRPRGWPILGNLLQLDPTILHTQLEAWSKDLGPVYGLKLGRKHAVVVSDLGLIREVLRDRPKGYRRVRQIQDVLHELGANGVFAAEGEDWRKQRRLMGPAFSSGTMREAWPELRRITERLRKRLSVVASTGEPVEILHDMMHYTVDVTARLLFGRDLNTLENGSDLFRSNIDLIFSGINRRINAPLPTWRWLRMPADRRLDAAVEAVRKELRLIMGVTLERVGRDAAPAEASTLLEAMVQARDEDDPRVKFSDDEVFGNALTVLLAGEDTTANTLAWVCHYLAHHPQTLKRLQAEADNVLGDETTLRDYADVASLGFAGAVAREVLRLRSPAPVMFYEPMTELTLGDVLVPQGTLVITLTRRAEIDSLGADGGEFRPERWPESRGQGQGPADARGSLAFGDGPRICPGRGLALVECALVVSMLARSFDFVAVPGDEPSERFNFVVQPRGLRVALRPRQKVTEPTAAQRSTH